MAIVKFEIDTLTTPMDAVAEVLRILSGGSVAAHKKESKKAAEPVNMAKTADVIEAKDAESDKTEKAVTIEDVRAAVAAKRTTHRQEIKDILTKHGAESVTALDPANYAAVRNEINAL